MRKAFKGKNLDCSYVQKRTSIHVNHMGMHNTNGRSRRGRSPLFFKVGRHRMVGPYQQIPKPDPPATIPGGGRADHVKTCCGGGDAARRNVCQPGRRSDTAGDKRWRAHLQDGALDRSDLRIPAADGLPLRANGPYPPQAYVGVMSTIGLDVGVTQNDLIKNISAEIA
jgi:hypothetical protein